MAAVCTMLACGEGDDGTEVTPEPAELTVDRGSVDFGSVTLGQTSARVTLIVANGGGSASSTPVVTLSGAGFTLVSNTCTKPVAPRRNCVVALAFAPTTSGPATGALSIVADPGGTLDVALEGDGVTVGALSLDATNTDLGPVVVGQTSATRATYTVRNDGGQDTGPVRVQAGGSAPSEFTLDDQCSDEVLAPGASCTFYVTFTPRSRGAKTASFDVRATPGGKVSAVVNGLALAPARIVIAPTTQGFGTVALDAQSPPLSLVVTNVGDDTARALSIDVTGRSADLFSASDDCDADLAGGASCTVTIVFAPTTLGEHAAELVVSSEAQSVTSFLSGEAVETQLTIEPSATTFEPTGIGELSAERTFTLKNKSRRGSGAITVTLAGSDPGEFELVANDCPEVLGPGERCTLSARFAPTRGGLAAAEVIVASLGSGRIKAAISGTGLTPANLVITPADKGFGSVPVGRSSAKQTFAVENTGGQPSGRVTVALAGVDADQFAIASNLCLSRVQPGRRCLIEVRFRPRAIGLANATLEVTATPGNPVSAALSGDGVDPQQLLIMPSTFAFAPTALGDVAVMTFTIDNDSNAATGLLSVDKAGPNARDFTVSHDCRSLAPQASCTATVTFAPGAAGLRTATLDVSASPGGVASSALSGVGRTRLEVVAIDGTPTIAPLDFGDVIVGVTTPRELDVTVRNNTTAAAPLTVGGSFGTPAQFTIVSNTCPGTIAPDATCTVRARFVPTSVGPKTGTLTFAIGATSRDRFAQSLIGRGIHPLSITPVTTSNFGDVSRNTTSAPLSFTVTNGLGAPTSGALATTLSGAGYRIVDDACVGLTLAPGDSCIIALTFSATTNGNRNGTLGVSATPGGTPTLLVSARGVDPVGAAPTSITLTPSSVFEGVPVGTLVGVLATTDADPADTYRYTLVAGSGNTGNAAFTIDGATLHTAVALDREARASYPIRVRVTDSGGQVFEQRLVVTVDDVDEPSVVDNDVAFVREDAEATLVDVLANDRDPDTDLTIATVTQPQRGIVAIAADARSVTYKPTANYCNTPPGNSLDTFTYTLAGSGLVGTVEVTVDCEDDPGIAMPDTAAATQGDPARAIDVLANDADPDGALRITSVTQPPEGTVVVTGEGTGLTYQPAANPTATTDVFTYTLVGGSSTTVTVTVTILDDLPTAVADTATVNEDAAATAIAVLTNDTDSDGGPKLVTAITQPANGTVTLVGGVVSYAPAANYCNTPPGSTLDVFTYTLNGGSSATVSVTVTCVDDNPSAVADTLSVAEDAGPTVVAVLANDTDIDGGALTVTAVTAAANGTVNLDAGVVTYQPSANYCNTPPGTTLDTFTYTVTGGSTGTVTVTVTCVDDAPVAVADAATIAEDANAPAVVVLTNDTDIDGGPKSITAVTQGGFGTVTITGGGSGLTYQPGADYCNTPPGTALDTFTYTLNGGSSATVTMTVTCSDDLPVAVDDTATVAEDAAATSVLVLTNDTDVDAGPKLVTAVTQPTNGVVVITGGGAGLTYAPAGNYCNSPPGTTLDTFTYTVTGGDTATVSMTVTCVDDNPVAVADAITVGEDANPTAVSVLINDTDIDGGAKLVTTITQPANGVVAITGGGTGLTYAPDADYCNSPPGTALDTFMYTITGGASATVTVTVLCGDDFPVAVNDGFTVDEDAIDAELDVLANDSDGDGGAFFIASFTQPTFGDLEANDGDTALLYTPDPNYCNTPPGTTLDTFTYTLVGGLSATVTINVTCIDDAPLAVADAATISEDATATTIPVLTNDTDIDAGPKTITSVTQPTNGTVVITNAGAGLTYVPASNYCNTPPGTALDTFTYTLAGGSAATVTMTVTCVDDAPIAVADAATVTEDAATTTIVVVTNDTDVDAGPKSVASVTQPLNGTVTLESGVVAYRPNANYCNTPPGSALDTFTYTLTPGTSTATVSMTVTCVDDPPVAVADAATVAENAATTTIVVLTNDTDIDAGPKTISAITQPANGTVAIINSGNGLSYVPTPGYCNTPPGTTLDTFTYTLSPGTSTATVSMTVTCVDDNPVAIADAATVAEDALATSIDVLANDTDGDGGSKLVTSTTQPANGQVVITGGGTGLTYRPAANYCNTPPGTTLDTFTYTLTPGGSSTTVSITVSCVDDAPVAVANSATVAEDAGATTLDVLANDTDVDAGPKSITAITQPANGTVAITGGGTGVSYQPTTNYCNTPPGSALDTFTYTLNGGSSATVSMTVTCIDDAPVAVADAYTVVEDANIATFTVLGNDTDVDAGPKTITSVEQPTNGTVTINGGGASVTYKPNANYCNTPPGTALDTFSYTLNGGSTATVAMTVTCVDDNPVAVADAATVAENAPATTINVLANDTDVDGGAITIASASALNGTVVRTNGNTSLTYQPAADYCNNPPGTTLDTLTYTLSPGGSTATVAITVTCFDTAPVAIGDTATVIEDAAATAIDVLANDTDIDGGPKTITSIASPPNRGGTVVITGGGTGLTYQPAANFCSTGPTITDRFTYNINGGAQANVAVTVTCVDDPPVARDDMVTMREGQQLGFSPYGNDDDPDEGPIAIATVSPTEDGNTVSITGGGTSISYQTVADYCGSDAFTYTLSPGGSQATVRVTVTCINDAPSFTKGPDINVVNQDDGGAGIAHVITPWATNLSKGPANESAQTLSFVVTDNTNSALFTVQPTLTATGAVQFTTDPAVSGSATITVHIQDDGGTANGGVNTSATQTFVITTTPPVPLASDDAYTATGNVYISVPTTEGVLQRGTDDTLNGAALDFYGATASPNVAVDGTSTVTTTNGGTVLLNLDGSFSYNPPRGYVGTDTFYYRITNGGGSDVGQVTMTITNMVWFFDANAGSAGDGRLATPFKAIASFVNDNGVRRGQNGQSIFLFAGSYTSGLTLRASQRVLGEGSTQSFVDFTGITLAPFSPAIPTGGTRPTISTTAGNAITLSGNNQIRGLDIRDRAGEALQGVGFGTLTIREVAITGAGGGTSFNNGTLAGALDSVTCSSTANCIYVDSVATIGTFDLGTGDVSSAIAFAVLRSTGSFSYAGTVRGTINIGVNTGGAVTLSGSINPGTGAAAPVNLDLNVNFSATFSGATKRFAPQVSQNPGVNITNNTTTTVTFSGGGLEVGGGGLGFGASGAGTTLTVSGSGNVASAMGTALSLTGVTIGAGNVRFERVSAGLSSATNPTGIIINDTAGTGSINITGNGTADSGGVIQNKNGTDGQTASGIGIYLANTRNVNLSHMRITGAQNFALRGINVVGFSLVDSVVNGTNGNKATLDEGSVVFTNAAGTYSIGRTTLEGGFEDNLAITSAASGSLDVTLETITINANSLANGNDGVRIESRGSAALTLALSNGAFTSARGDLLQVVHASTGTATLSVQDTNFSNNHAGIATGGGGVVFNVAGNAGQTSLSFTANTMRNALGHALLITKGQGASVLQATVGNNTCGVFGTANSGSLEGSCMRLQTVGGGTLQATVTNNRLYQYNNFGIDVVAGGGASAQSGVVNTHITGNTISAPGTFVGANSVPKYGIYLNIGTTPGDTFSACALVGGSDAATKNTLFAAGKDASPVTLGDLDFRVRQRMNTTFRLPGYGGGATNTTALHTYLVGRNDGGGTPAGLVEATTTGFTGTGTTCF